MEGYLKAQFRRHQGINAMFMRFLMRTMANQTAAGSKASTDSLTKQVKKLQDEHATAKALEKWGGEIGDHNQGKQSQANARLMSSGGAGAMTRKRWGRRSFFCSCLLRCHPSDRPSACCV